MSDPAWSTKADGQRRHERREAEKRARAKARDDAAARAKAAEREAAKERAREARQARSRMDTEEHRRRQEQFREETKKMHSTPDGASTYYRLQFLQVLGLRADQDTPKMIRKAHRTLALRYHPDKNTDADAPAMFRKIQAAYEALAPEAPKGGAGGEPAT